jgi:MFS family permease
MFSTAGTTTRATTSRYAIYVLAVMVGINFLNYMDRFVGTAVSPYIQDEFRLSDFEVGALASVFLLIYAVGVIPFGFWADRGSRKNVIAAGVTIWSLATLVTGLTRNYLQLLLTRAFLGVGEASYYPSGTSLLADYFPKHSRGRAMSIWSAGTVFGAAAGFIGGGLIASRFGWRAAFFFTAVPGLLFALLAYGLREAAKGEAEHRGPALHEVKDANWQTFKGLWRIRTLRSTIISETILFFVLSANVYWLPIYIHRQFQVPSGRAAILSGGVLLGGALVGSLLGGYIADRMGRTDARGYLLVGIAGFLLGAVSVAIALFSPNLTVFIPAFFISAMALYLYNGPFTALKQNIVVPSLRASAITLSLFVEHLFGDWYSPGTIGEISDLLNSLQLALMISPFGLLAAAAVAAIGLRTIGHETAAMEETWARRGEAPLEPAALRPS